MNVQPLENTYERESEIAAMKQMSVAHSFAQIGAKAEALIVTLMEHLGEAAWREVKRYVINDHDGNVSLWLPGHRKIDVLEGSVSGTVHYRVMTATQIRIFYNIDEALVAADSRLQRTLEHFHKDGEEKQRGRLARWLVKLFGDKKLMNGSAANDVTID